MGSIGLATAVAHPDDDDRRVRLADRAQRQAGAVAGILRRDGHEGAGC
jgi:hypothetical protein